MRASQPSGLRGGWLSTSAIRRRDARKAKARLAPARPPPTMIRSNCCMTAIMPLQGKETRRSGWIAATGLRLVLARPAIVVGARPMLLLLLAAGPATAGLAVRHRIAALGAAAVRFIAGNTVAGRQLDFQLDDFVPLLIGAIALRHGEKFAQPATGIYLRCSGRDIFGRVFWIGIVHWKIKKRGEPQRRTPHYEVSDYFFLAALFLAATDALKAVPAVNFGTVVAGILSVAPVFGFLPVRAARLAALKVPKPTRVTDSPLVTVLTTAPMMAVSALSAAALVIPASFAATSTSSDLFIYVPP